MAERTPQQLRPVVSRSGTAPVRQRVPEDKSLRESLLRAVSERVGRLALVPPLTLDELRAHAEEILSALGAEPAYLDFTTVLVGNETWRETFAGIPYDRRVLLLPQCLRHRHECPAPIDEIGLLCEGCGRCAIGGFIQAAETLGYVVLVAEGTTVVTKLLEQGRVDAVVGVSCLHVLERAFPHAAAHAIPSLAFPLYRDGCEATDFDQDWLREALHLRTAARWSGRVDIDHLRQEVEAWFQPAPLRELLDGAKTPTEVGFSRRENLLSPTEEGFSRRENLLSPTEVGFSRRENLLSPTEEEALAWLLQGGKRWRPLLAACIYQALSGSELTGAFPKALRKVAVATECFHKASLLHDDLEDHDEYRYGQPTPGRRLGMPIALNLGDFLIGEGYRLLTECELPPATQARLFRAAAEGHRNLCLAKAQSCPGSGSRPNSRPLKC